jgi:hypothetical protein
MTKKFMVSVANVNIYNVDTGALLAIGKTLIDSSLEMTLGSTDIRGGRGNVLQAIAWHTSDLNIKVSETQFNLDFLALSVGSDVTTGSSVYQEESVTLVANSGTVVGTPIASVGTNLYGWVTSVAGTEKVTFTGQAFTSALATATETVCVRYYATNSAARSLTINADILPKIVRVEMETLLISSQNTTNRIGVVQIIVPTCTLLGGFSLSMTSDGVSSTPLALRALANQDLTSAACSTVPVLAKIIEVLDSANFYDNLIGISIQGGDFSMAATGTRQLIVWGVPQTGAAFQIPLTGTNMTFTSSVGATATIGVNNGLVTGVAINGSTPTLIHATVTGKPALDAQISVICT